MFLEKKKILSVEPPCATTSQKQPPIVNNYFAKRLNFSDK